MVSTKGRYALRVMLDLAQHGGFTENINGPLPIERGSFIPLDEIADRQGISKKYLEIILKVLVQHNLLKGLRGKGGGYKLTRTPENYTIGEILTLTEGSLSIVSCLQETDGTCRKKSDCLTFPMWKKFDQMTHDFFFGITLADLIHDRFRQAECSEDR